ncbi:universal stress protein [Cellulomonas terrae]|uniref:Universal stress protein n=1 Tax=Cellulomonas terrae TaxID=311234 RepID=A0A511JH33_9CELL|nr:universal stress protein [Cellulomonas terrae]GEL97284.1 universal stress protein [Cellulomonas terrae]
MSGHIVIGYDGSPEAQEALEWAADEARRERRPLRIVHVGLGQGGGRSLTEGVERVRSAAPDVEITSSLELRDSVPGTLVDMSTDARMLVVGGRGLGGFAGLLLGSVSTAVAAHARCPVVVVRHRPGSSSVPLARPVVVGVDGSRTSTSAVDLAFDLASRREAPLLAVHAWEMPALLGPTPAWTPDEIADRLVAEKALLAESLAGHADRYPDVEVRSTVRLGGAAEIVLAASGDAQLVVLGSRGRGGFTGLLLGSVSHAVVHHATCPVAIVHPHHAR